MMRKRVLIFLLLAMILSILAAEQALAGCCVGTSTGTCIPDTNGVCSSGQYTATNCSTTICAKGCCCDLGSTTGDGDFNFSCSIVGDTFYLNQSINIGDDCACGIFP